MRTIYIVAEHSEVLIGPKLLCLYVSYSPYLLSVTVCRAINNGRPSAIFRAKSAFDLLSNKSSGHSGQAAYVLHSTKH